MNLKSLEQRIEALEAKLETSEARVTVLEAKHAAREARSDKLIPRELREDPRIQELCRSHAERAIKGWQESLLQNDASLEAMRFRESVDRSLRQLEQKAKEEKEREDAEIEAAVQFYTLYGRSPIGYEIIDEREVSRKPV